MKTKVLRKKGLFLIVMGNMILKVIVGAEMTRLLRPYPFARTVSK